MFRVNQLLGFGVKSQSSATSTLINGLVGYWKLEEASGNRLDSSGNSHTMIKDGTVNQITGKIGYGCDFTRNNRLENADAAFDFGTLNTSFTWAAWVNVDAVDSNNNTFMAFRPAGTNNRGHSFYTKTYGTTGKATLSINDIQKVLSVAGVSAGTWNLVVGYYNVADDTIGVSLNGATYVTAAGANLSAVVGGTMTLGSNNAASNGNDLNGGLDEVGVWNRVLTQTEVTSLYNSGVGITYPF